MKILDSDLLIGFLRGHPKAVEVFQTLGDDAFTTTLNAAELFEGAAGASRPDEALSKVDQLLSRLRLLPFGPRAARAFGVIRREHKRRGAMVAVMDTLIGSIAAAEGASIVTRNVKDFGSFPGVRVETWAD
ncbi:MAG: type II toxin-antitoxin system VapC family toxin [Euryarchaeota archaeon]|nr:type II toxin-antitoxin system VapC family toxin [Euryarchaeota archaeon]